MKTRSSWREAVEEYTTSPNDTRVAEASQELLEARSSKLSGARTTLFAAAGPSETKVLGVFRDLNEKIYQVAARSTGSGRGYSRCSSPIYNDDSIPILVT